MPDRLSTHRLSKRATVISLTSATAGADRDVRRPAGHHQYIDVSTPRGARACSPRQSAGRNVEAAPSSPLEWRVLKFGQGFVEPGTTSAKSCEDVRMKLGEGAAAVAVALVLAACTSSGGQTSNASRSRMTAARTSRWRPRPRRSTCSTRSPARSRSRPSTKALDDVRDHPPDQRLVGRRDALPHRGRRLAERRTASCWPTLWSPASTVWTERVAAAASPSLVGEPESFTRTPVVFGVPETMARALG